MFKKNLSSYLNIIFYSKLKLFFFLVFNCYNKKFFYHVIKNLKFSYSQIFQDLFVIYELDLKKKGFFIEIGGGDGMNLSNTYLLETKYFWDGVVCEPDKRLLKKIKKNRKCKIITNPVSDSCKKLNFYESSLYNSSLIKTKKSKKISAKSICLNHLIEKIVKKPIDYISIDTEGNELNILKKFNFKKYKIKIFTIEHNYSKNREKIYNLLKKNGYIRKYKYISLMDDWYVLKI